MDKKELYDLFKKYQKPGFQSVNLADLDDKALNNLTCFCCGVLLKDCLTLKEEGSTYLNIVSDPGRFNNLPDGFLKRDSAGRSLYIPLCGTNEYEA